MIAHKHLVMDFIETIDSARDFNDCFHALSNTAQQLGFEGVLFTYIPPLYFEPGVDLKPIFKASDSFTPAFLRHYAEAGFAENDFTIKRISKGESRVINWWQMEQEGQLNTHERAVIETAREDYGIRNGFTIPTLVSTSAIAGASFICADNDRHFSLLYETHLRDLRHVAKLFSDKVIAEKHYQSVFVLPFLQCLSETEFKVLKYLSAGRCLKNVQSDLGVSYKYAGNLVEKIRHKFGGISTNRLMYLAGLLNIGDIA